MIIKSKIQDRMSFVGFRQSNKRKNTSSMLQNFVESDLITKHSPLLSVYTEKVHIFENNVLKEIILVIYNGELNFLFIEKKG